MHFVCSSVVLTPRPAPVQRPRLGLAFNTDVFKVCREPAVRVIGLALHTLLHSVFTCQITCGTHFAVDLTHNIYHFDVIFYNKA